MLICSNSSSPVTPVFEGMVAVYCVQPHPVDLFQPREGMRGEPANARISQHHFQLEMQRVPVALNRKALMRKSCGVSFGDWYQTAVFRGRVTFVLILAR